MTDIIVRHFVTFFTPGTLVVESSTKQIDSWDIAAAVLALGIKDRYAAVPFGFQFTTRERGPEDLDSLVVATSPLYYLGGTVETLDQLEARATEKDRTLIANMRNNQYDRIITNDNSYRWTQPLWADDVVLQWP